MSRKRTTSIRKDRNIHFSKEERKSVSIQTTEHMINNKTIVYIDETGFNKNFIPLYGFAVKNKRCFVPGLSKSKNYSCIVAMINEKIIGLQIIEGSVKSGDFGCFLLKLIKLNFPAKASLNNVVFFMDNAQIHKSDSLKELRNFIKIQFNAPYSPALNPIEELFSLAKYYFRELNLKNNLNFLKNIYECFKYINKKQINGFIIHSFKFILNCILLNDI